MKLSGTISIGRRVPGDGEDSIYIDVVTREGVRIVQANLSLQQFALALTGLGPRPAELDIRGMDFTARIEQ